MFEASPTAFAPDHTLIPAPAAAPQGTLPTFPADFETKSADADADTDAGGEQTIERARRYRPRRTLSDRVREAVLSLADGKGDVLSHEETAWASITFAGTRHEVVLEFKGAQAVAAGEEFIADLPEHEFTIPAQLVAEATVSEVDHRFGETELMRVTAVLLLLEEV